MADLETLQTQLSEAEAAYHLLMMGKATTQLQLNGRMVIYKASEADTLKAYIVQLESKISVLNGGATSAPISFGI